jgi:hypothetical protein
LFECVLHGECFMNAKLFLNGWAVADRNLFLT